MINKEYYRKKAPKGFDYQGKWDNLHHYAKQICIYNNRYIALKIVKGGILFKDLHEKDFVKMKKGVFKSHAEIEKFSRSTEYQTVSCIDSQIDDGTLYFMAQNHSTYQPLTR